MIKLAEVKPKNLARALVKLGFSSHPGKGSHIIFFKNDGKQTSLPMHPKPIGKGLLAKILKQLNISREEISQYL